MNNFRDFHHVSNTHIYDKLRPGSKPELKITANFKLAKAQRCTAKAFKLDFIESCPGSRC